MHFVLYHEKNETVSIGLIRLNLVRLCLAALFNHALKTPHSLTSIQADAADADIGVSMESIALKVGTLQT